MVGVDFVDLFVEGPKIVEDSDEKKSSCEKIEKTSEVFS